MGADELRNCKRFHVLRLGPLAVGLAVVGDVFSVFQANACRRGSRIPLAQRSDFVSRIAAHGIVIFFEDFAVAVGCVHIPRNQYTRIGPTRRAVHRVHVAVHTTHRGNLGEAAVLMLGIAEVTLILAGKGRVVEQRAGCGAENLRIARPAVALPRGAVGGQVGVVVFGAPHGAVKEFVQQFVGGREPPRALHIGVDGNSRKVCRVNRDFTLDQHILKSENRKRGLIIVSARLADIVHLLQGRCDFFIGCLDVFLGKLAVFIQHFAKAQADALPGLCLHGKLQNARNILPEIQHCSAAGGVQDFRRQTLVFGQRLVVGCGRLHRVGCYLGVATVGRCAPRVDALAVLVVGKAHRAVVRPLPASIGANGLHRAVGQHQFQLRQELCLSTVLVAQAPRAAAAAIPAIGQLHGQRVFAALHQRGYVVGLVLHPFAVVGDAGGQRKALDGLPIEGRLIHAACCGVEPRFFDFTRHERRFKAVYRVTALRVGDVVPRDPLRAPIVGVQQSQFKYGGFRPVAGHIVFIPQAHLPHHMNAAVQRRARVDRVHRAAFDFAGIPQQVFILVVADNLIRRLPHTVRAVPEQSRRGKVNP